MFKRYICYAVMLMCFGVVCLPGSLGAEENGSTDKDRWIFSVQPYAWLPTMEADLKFSTPSGAGGSPEVEIEPDDYLENLEGGVLITTEARKGRWSLTADFIFMKISSSVNKVKRIDFGGSQITTDLDVGSDVDMKSFITTFAGGYQIVDEDWVKMDVVAGLRYLWMEADLDWRLSETINGPGGGHTFPESGSLKEDGDIWNGVAGLRGHFLLGQSSWFIPFHFDIGAGDSDLTWQAFSGLGYSFSDRIQALLGFRHIEFEEDGAQGIQELKLSGPALGVHINF